MQLMLLSSSRVPLHALQHYRSRAVSLMLRCDYSHMVINLVLLSRGVTEHNRQASQGQGILRLLSSWKLSLEWIIFFEVPFSSVSFRVGEHVSLTQVSHATTGVHSFGMFRDVRSVQSKNQTNSILRWRADNDTYEARLQASVKSNFLYIYHELTWLSALRNIGSSLNHV
jgi:hypothetical protein